MVRRKDNAKQKRPGAKKRPVQARLPKATRSSISLADFDAVRGDFDTNDVLGSTRLRVDILQQPNDTTCGPTCLQAIYRYWGDSIKLNTVIDEVPALAEGGTLAVFLACHALRRGYRARIFTYNLHVFDPTWFGGNHRGVSGRSAVSIEDRLRKQMASKNDTKLQLATLGYLDFLKLGGELAFEDLRPEVFLRFLTSGQPILTGLSATWLYRSMRELGETNTPSDTAGEPAGHFVVLSGYNHRTNSVLVADPYRMNPAFGDQYYEVSFDRLITAILLGIVTYDANLLVIEPAQMGNDRRAPRKTATASKRVGRKSAS